MSEVYRLFDRWLAKTKSVLLLELSKQGIGVTDELSKSLDENLIALGGGYLRGEISFLTRGRFVDMGSGKGYKAGGVRVGGDLSRGKKLRRPKKWFSRVMYGRLNDLQGAVGFKIMEQAVEAIKQPMNKI